MKNKSMSSDKPSPFLNDAEYLLAEFRWLKARCQRITAERATRGWLDAPKEGGLAASSEVEALVEIEAQLRAETDGRIEATRAIPGGFQLGLDKVFEVAQKDRLPLDPKDRIILLGVLVPGISQSLAESVFAPLNINGFGRLIVEDLIRLLDPQTPADWLQYRTHFRYASALTCQELITVHRTTRPVGPDSLIDSGVTLTLKAFSIITGDHDAVYEDLQGEVGHGN
jgi:hypothetical protein